MLQRKLAPALMAITVALFVVLPMDAGAGKRNHHGQARIHGTHHQVLAGYGHRGGGHHGNRHHSGYGYGSRHGYGYGSRYGYGHRYGSGHRYGYRSRYGYGRPYRYGSGHRYGYGYADDDYPRYGDLRIKVKPKRADVYVDGAHAGVVDDFDGRSQKMRLSPGRHDLVIHYEGYRTIKLRIFVSAGRTYKIEQRMEELPDGEIAEPPLAVAHEPRAEHEAVEKARPSY